MTIFEAANCGPFTQALVTAAARWGIVTIPDQARWLAQLSVESAGFTKTRESMAYRPETLLRVANGRNGLVSLEQAEQIVQAGQEAVAEALYGGSWGRSHLGNVNDGDGWKFIGHGLIEITGRDNHRAASMGCYGDERLVTAPDLITLTQGAADTAAWFWYSRHLSSITDVTEITRRINGGNNALAERVDMTNKLMAV